MKIAIIYRNTNYGSLNKILEFDAATPARKAAILEGVNAAVAAMSELTKLEIEASVTEWTNFPRGRTS